MALISSAARCAICNQPLDRPFTATSGIAFDVDHRLFWYCDAPLHFDCLETWRDREEFSRKYYENSLKRYRDGYYGTLLEAGDSWLLGCGIGCVQDEATPWLDEPYFAEVRLLHWPFRLYSYWREWDDFVAGAFREKLVGAALRSAEEIMMEVRALVPTQRALAQLRAQRIAQSSW